MTGTDRCFKGENVGEPQKNLKFKKQVNYKTLKMIGKGTKSGRQRHQVEELVPTPATGNGAHPVKSRIREHPVFRYEGGSPEII